MRDCIGGKLCRGLRAAGCIPPREFSLFSEVDFSLISSIRSHHMQQQCNSCHIRGLDWMQRNRRHIIYDADFVPRHTSGLCYNVQDSALFTDGLRKSLLMLTKAAYPFFFDAPLAYRGFNEANVSK
jgi:hypothetical protein